MGGGIMFREPYGQFFVPGSSGAMAAFARRI